MSVTFAAGFTAAGVAAGIKPNGVEDVALVAGQLGCLGAAVFTDNRTAAAPVVVSKAAMSAGPELRAVVVNSGCANAATGVQGLSVATAMARAVAADLDCDPHEVVVCSTGAIGSRLDEAVATAGCRRAAARLADDGGADAAAAILTTDTTTKTATASAGGFRIGGMAKGAGMIRPDMATMLAVLTTDAVVDPSVLDGALRGAVEPTFNSLDIDGCASTNDTVALMASGASGVSPEPSSLAAALTEVCASLAEQIAADAEGSSRVVTLKISGASDDRTARQLGRTIADSALVRASFYGGDPNWGRILGALGTSPVAYTPELVGIVWDGVAVTAGGEAVDFDEDALAADIAVGDFTVVVNVGSGPGSASVFTTDLTPEYAVFNGVRS